MVRWNVFPPRLDHHLDWILQSRSEALVRLLMCRMTNGFTTRLSGHRFDTTIVQGATTQLAHLITLFGWLVFGVLHPGNIGIHPAATGRWSGRRKGSLARARATRAPHLRHTCATQGPQQRHTCTTPAPHQRHTSATPAPHQRHTRAYCAMSTGSSPTTVNPSGTRSRTCHVTVVRRW